MKKFLVSILCLLCVFSFAGCDKREVSSPAITMDRYFKSTVVSRVNNKNTDMNLSSFIANSPDDNTLKLHNKLTFSGITTWTYNLNVECVYFYFYSTKTIEVDQLVFTMTALDGGVSDATINNYKVEETLSFNATKNQGILLRVDIGHKVTEDSLELTIELKDEALLKTEFSWTIYGLQVYGDM